MNWFHFIKLAVSRLIMVWFKKVKIWHAQAFKPDLLDINVVTRNITHERWCHARVAVTGNSSQFTFFNLVAISLLWAYLSNRVVDFLHFLHASWYRLADHIWQKPLKSGRYPWIYKVFALPWQWLSIYPKSEYAMTYSLPIQTCVCNFVKIRS